MKPILLFAIVVACAPALRAQQTVPTLTNQARPGFSQRLGQPVARPLEATLMAVDKAARTVALGPLEGSKTTLAEVTVFQLRTNAYILRSGKKVTLADVVVGERLRFYAKKDQTGKETITLLLLSPPAGTRPPTGPANPK